MPRKFLPVLLLALLSAEPSAASAYDVIIRGGSVYDGSGGAPIQADVAITGDRIVAVGKLGDAKARNVVEARGLAVSPGFINMLSWSTESLIEDGRSQSEIRQGVTLEIMGEGSSMGPLNAAMKRRLRAAQTDIRYDVAWTTLAEYLRHLEKRGISTNVASFIGAATIRQHVLGLGDVRPTPAQLDEMRALVRREMEEGALGVGTALIYAPGMYAKTEELVELCRVAAAHKGKYTSHVRGEGDRLIEAIEELIRISRDARIPAEIHHIKAAGPKNWAKMARVLEMVEAARAEGLAITANMYPYAASSTGLSSRIPSWAHDGGAAALYARIGDPVARARMVKEMRKDGPYVPSLLVRFRTEALRPLIGKTLAEVAESRGKDEVETLLDLVLEDRSRVQAVFFSMDEANLVKQLRKPWVSISSDGASIANEGVFLRASTHPRGHGSFARILGKYVRDEKVITLQEAVRRMSGLPATNLGLEGRGFLKEGMYADVVVFDPATVADRATYENPHQYAVGVQHVFVNGVQVLKDGEHTGAKPGRAVWGPGKIR
jgi:N-acyl-D-amino-acid deacylase